MKQKANKNKPAPHVKPALTKTGEGRFFSSADKPEKPFISPVKLQAKLAIGEPNDTFEQEADRMADTVVQKFADTSNPKSVQSKRNNEPKVLKASDGDLFGMDISRKPATEGMGASEIHSQSIESRLNASKGRGQALSPDVKSGMESVFATDFSDVRIHNDSEAAEMNKELGAQAFTNGSDIYFNESKFNTDSDTGKKLLAHELTHTIQQGKSKRRIQKYDHKVRTGESLSVIAARYGVSIQELRKANKSIPKSSIVQPGQIITIPIRQHTVKSGDYLGKIAARYKVSVDEIKKINKLSSDVLHPKQVLAIPNVQVKAGAATKTPAKTSGAKPSVCKRYYNKTGKIIKANPQKYPSGVVMERHVIANEDNFTVLAKKYWSDNKVTNVGQLADEFKKVNTHISAKKLGVGDCVIILKHWTHPNIGKLPTKGVGASVAANKLPADVRKAIATVYSEQWKTGANSKTQQKYIWYSIRLRIETSLKGATLGAVLKSSEYHGIGGALYTSAMKELNSGKIKSAGLKNAKDTVLKNYKNSIPADAGLFYFHWTKACTSEKHYNTTVKKKSKALAKGKRLSFAQLLKIEKESVWVWANSQGWDAGLSKLKGWRKKIESDGGTKRGAMYIFKGF